MFFGLTGCAVLSEIKLPGIATASELNDEFRKEQKYRREYQETGSPEAIRWLKAHRIKPGMTIGTVNEILGEDGRRVYDDTRFKSHGGHYRAGDETYKWGPDAEGSSHLLMFRSDRIVNYDPQEFQ